MTRKPRELRLIPVPVEDEFVPGDSVGEKLLTALKRANVSLQAGDILVVKHKIVSKAEGRLVALAEVKPSQSSKAWGRRFGVDPRVTEVALAQSTRIVRRKR